MSHFVALKRYIPSPEDDIDTLYVPPSGAALVGLWGCKDGDTVLTVRVISGPGTAMPKEMRGTAVQVWSFTGLTAASKIQGFSGSRPFTGVLKVSIGAGASSLADENKALLSGSNPKERA